MLELSLAPPPPPLSRLPRCAILRAPFAATFPSAAHLPTSAAIRRAAFPLPTFSSAALRSVTFVTTAYLLLRARRLLAHPTFPFACLPAAFFILLRALAGYTAALDLLFPNGARTHLRAAAERSAGHALAVHCIPWLPSHLRGRFLLPHSNITCYLAHATATSLHASITSMPSNMPLPPSCHCTCLILWQSVLQTPLCCLTTTTTRHSPSAAITAPPRAPCRARASRATPPSSFQIPPPASPFAPLLPLAFTTNAAGNNAA